MFIGHNSSFGTTATTDPNPMKDFEVTCPSEDTVSSLAFSSGAVPQNYLIAGSWDGTVSYFFYFKFAINFISVYVCV